MSNLMSHREEETFLHSGLHTLTKMIVFLAVTFLAGLWMDVRYLAPVFIIGLALNFVAKTPKKWFLVMLTALALTLLPTLRSTVGQANPDYYKVLSAREIIFLLFQNPELQDQIFPVSYKKRHGFCRHLHCQEQFQSVLRMYQWPVGVDLA